MDQARQHSLHCVMRSRPLNLRGRTTNSDESGAVLPCIFWRADGGRLKATLYDAGRRLPNLLRSASPVLKNAAAASRLLRPLILESLHLWTGCERRLTCLLMRSVQ